MLSGFAVYLKYCESLDLTNAQPQCAKPGIVIHLLQLDLLSVGCRQEFVQTYEIIHNKLFVLNSVLQDCNEI